MNLIMEYLDVFQKLYEKTFGKMETGKSSSALGEIKKNTIFIKSTGYGVKVVLGLLMADRMHVVERKRKLEREIVGLMEVEVEHLEYDAKDCPICQDPMGIESPEGIKETPLQMVICCGQVIGARCLRAWLGELVYEDVYRDNCPTCRFKFPGSFLETLFSKDEYAARIGKEGYVIDLVSPAPEPAETIRAQQEQDALLREGFGGGGESREGAFIDVDDDMEVHSPPALIGMRRERIPTGLELFGRSGFPQIEPGELAEGELMEDDFDLEG